MVFPRKLGNISLQTSLNRHFRKKRRRNTLYLACQDTVFNIAKFAGHAFSYHILNTVLKRAILGDLRRAGNSGQIVAIDF